MQAFDSLFAQNLYNRVRKAHEEAATRILHRGSIKTIDDYNAELTRLDTFDLVIDLIKDEYQKLMHPEGKP